MSVRGREYMRMFPAGWRKGRLPYIIMIVLMVLMASMKNQRVLEERRAVKSTMKEQIVVSSVSLIEGLCSPVLEFAKQEEREFHFIRFIEEIIFSPMPVLAFMGNESQMQYVYESESTKNLLLNMVNTENREEPMEQVSSNNELLEQENRMVFMEQENQNVQKEFQMQKEKQHYYDWESIADYESLIKTFYIVDSGTAVEEGQINYQALMEPDMSIEVKNEGPQILIYHTHSNEAFVDSVSGDDSTTIVGVGERLAECLRAYGYDVMHHTKEYDAVRSNAYGVALPEIEKLLQENPSIEVVIDLHRDEVAEDRKLITDIQGRPTAQIMFFNGLSRTKERGDIAYLENPNIAQNLAFSFQMQVAANEYYPGWTRKIYLKGYRYNMHLLPKYLLVELGAQTNTVEEMKNACDPLAHILYLVLSGQNKQ